MGKSKIGKSCVWGLCIVVCTQSLEIAVYTVKNELADPCCHNDMISLSITTGPNFFRFRTLVWNWKTGQLVFVFLIFFFRFPS